MDKGGRGVPRPHTGLFQYEKIWPSYCKNNMVQFFCARVYFRSDHLIRCMTSVRQRKTVERRCQFAAELFHRITSCHRRLSIVDSVAVGVVQRHRRRVGRRYAAGGDETPRRQISYTQPRFLHR